MRPGRIRAELRCVAAATRVLAQSYARCSYTPSKGFRDGVHCVGSDHGNGGYELRKIRIRAICFAHALDDVSDEALGRGGEFCGS